MKIPGLQRAKFKKCFIFKRNKQHENKKWSYFFLFKIAYRLFKPFFFNLFYKTDHQTSEQCRGHIFE